MRTGFIGTGSMGSILVEAFVRSKALNPDQIILANRTISKASSLANSYPGLKVSPSNKELVKQSDVIFICVKPLEYKQVVDEIQQGLRPSQTVVSITSAVLLKHLENLLTCKIIKMIPSITNYTLSGSVLCMYGQRVLPEDKEQFENLISQIGSPVCVEEEYTRVSSDLASCGPAFLAFFLQKWIDAAVEMTGIPPEHATILANEMTLGTGMLLTSGGFTPFELQKRVSVPGGITAKALHMMESELGNIFHQLVRITHDKYEEDLAKVEYLFKEKQ